MWGVEGKEPCPPIAQPSKNKHNVCAGHGELGGLAPWGELGKPLVAMETSPLPLLGTAQGAQLLDSA